MISTPDGSAAKLSMQCPHTEPVERERELALLRRLLDRVASGQAGLVVLEGPDGIGKSTLLRHLIWEAQVKGIRVREALCDPVKPEFPLSVVNQLLRPFPKEDGGAGAALFGNASPGERSPNGLSDNLNCSVVDPTGEVPYGVLLALHRMVLRMAADGPLLLAVDDAQNADHASMRFLAHTARRLVGLPVLLAVSRRPDADTSAAPLDEVSAQPMCHILRPRPLSDVGVGQIAQRLTGHSADLEFQRACLAATNGNPLLVTRLLVALRHEGQPLTAASLAEADGQGFTLFRRWVVRLLHKQSADTLRTVRAMAVLGNGELSEVYARLAKVDTTVCAQSVLMLGSIGLLTTTLDGRNWSFAHHLVQEVVLSDMTVDQRARAHLLAARLLHDGGAPAEQVAEHLRLSRPPVIESWAAAVLRETAREAALKGAYTHAVDLLRCCLPEADTALAADPALLMELGLAESRVDIESSVRHLTSALQHTTDPGHRLTVLSTLMGSLVFTGQAAAAINLLTEYKADVDVGCTDTAQLLEAQVLLASTVSIQTYRMMLDAVSFDLTLPGDTPGQRALLAARAIVSVTRFDRIQEAAAAARTVTDRGLRTTDAPSFIATAASVLLYADRPHEAAPVLRQLIDDTKAKHEVSYCNFLALSADACQRMGALNEALADAAVALEIKPPEITGPAHALPTAVRIHALLELGEVENAAETAARMSAPVTANSWQWNEFLCARGRLRLVEGKPGEALADLLDSGRRQHEWGISNPALSSWWYWAGQAHLAHGDTKSAAELAEEAVARARAGALPSALGTALGLLAATLGGHAGLTLLEEAQSVLEGTSTALDLIRVYVRHGRALYAAGRTQAAREVLRRGLETAYALGARALYQQAHQALLDTGARPRRPMSSGLGSLTPSETQVALRAADGQSNAEIAEELFVTQRTVEAHLTSVYRKLELSGRRELRGALNEGPKQVVRTDQAARTDQVVRAGQTVRLGQAARTVRVVSTTPAGRTDQREGGAA